MMTEEEASEFRKLFLGIMERTIPDGMDFPKTLAQRSLGSASDLMKDAQVTISEDPLSAASKIYRTAEECALCGLVPAPSERWPATLHLAWSTGGLGVGVWAHSECLFGCPVTDQQRGIPW